MNAIANPLDPNFPFPDKSIVIIGMPGAGKSTIARGLAKRLGLAFADSDMEIEKIAGMKIEKIFETMGEPEFRRLERETIARLLNESTICLATGGGAFMDESSRLVIREKAVSVWLRADLALLLERTSFRNNRPLLKRGDPEKILQELLEKREPFYSLADVVVDAGHRKIQQTVDMVIEALDSFFKASRFSCADYSDCVQRGCN